MPLMRTDNSPPAPFILGLGRDSIGGHAEVAGVWAVGHSETTGRASDVHPGFIFSAVGLAVVDR